MYCLLIVDDEPRIADYLFYVFSDYESVDLQVLKAYSAVEAMEMMKKNRVDIVLTDINMPLMNGLEFHKNIKEMWPSCKVIFLTGYNEFEYVLAALRNASVDYILKSEGEDRIIQAVTRAIEELGNEVKNRQLLENAWKNMEEVIPVLQERYMLDLLDGIEYNVTENIEHIKEFRIPLDPEMPVLLVTGRVDSWGAYDGLAGKSKVLYAVKDISSKQLVRLSQFCTVIYDRTKPVWFIQPSPESLLYPAGGSTDESWDRITVFVKSVINSVQESCKELLNVSISFAACKQPVCWERIPEIFERLKYEISKSSVLGNELLLIVDEKNMEINENVPGTDNQIVRMQLKKMDILEDMLENGQKDKFLEIFSDFIQSLEVSANIAYENKCEIYYSIATMFMSHLNRWGLNAKIGRQIGLDRLARIDEHESWRAAVAYFKQLACLIYDQKNNDGFLDANRIFGFIKNYTEQNLGGDLSLTKFAEMLHFHPFYLSRLFKQVTGKKISEYIAGVKLSRAREILKSKDMKINEIANALGFEAPSYFTRFFKKSTGMTPQEYRDSLKISG